MAYAPSRRQALALLGAAGLAAAAPARAEGARILGTWPLGVQLWSVHEQMATDVPGTLKRLKAAGYDVVETAGLYGLSPAAFRSRLDEAGLACRSAHVPMDALAGATGRAIDMAKGLGVEWLVCASPRPLAPIPAGADWVEAMRKAMTLEAWQANAADLARIAPQVAQAGLKLAYHNHFMEFADHGGTTGYEVITRAVDPSLLRLEIDLGWVMVGGADPLAVLTRHAGRVDMLHVKDFVRDPSQPLGWRPVDLGAGVIDWRPILAEARRSSVQLLFVEQEGPFARPVFDSLAADRAFLTSL